MKRIGNIYTRICERSNIEKAVLSASKGKKSRANVKKIIDNMEVAVVSLQSMLQKQEYVPSAYEEKKIYDGANKKERIIFKPRFYPDQCVHWALMLQIEEILKKGMYDYCCASVKGRGILYAVNHIKRILKEDRKNTKYCLKLDIKKFYPSIEKELLKRKFRRKIKCRETLNLIDVIIDSSKQGLPIGNYTSQWFANFFLQDLDHFIKEQLHIKYYIRYMDDMILFHRNKRELHKHRLKIEEFLKNENLNLKENWQLFKTESRPVDFVGYRFYRGYTTLRKSNFLRIKRRAKKIYKKEKLNVKDSASIISYCGWLKHCDSHNYNKKYIKPYINIKECKGVVSYANRKQFETRKI